MWLLGCGLLLGPRIVVYSAPPPSQEERYCAWFGDVRGDTLYFGESAFWWASRRAGNALGDLERPGPVRIGRFDLAEERLLESLEVGLPGERASVWDVLAHPNGRLYFTRYFEPAGFVDPESGVRRLLPELGQGLNELTLAPRGRIWVTRYPAPDGTPGGIVLLDEDGGLVLERRLPAPPGYLAAPKSLAVDPRSGELWLSMDLLPADRGSRAPVRHDGYVLDAEGSLLRSFETPHLHFPAFDAEGRAYLAEAEEGQLFLRVVPPAEDPLDPLAGVRVRLDPAFRDDLDFAQEVRPLAGGGALVIRWSGRVHHVDRDGRVASLTLPRPENGGLYYSGTLRDGRICATRCDDVSVVCADAPAPRSAR